MSPISHMKNFSYRESVERIAREYTSVDSRENLIKRYNDAVGSPSEFIIEVHNNFLNGRMEIDEVIAFVIISEELISAAYQWKHESTESIESTRDGQANEHSAAGGPAAKRVD